MSVVEIDYGNFRRGAIFTIKQTRFNVKISVRSGVIIKVLAGEIGKNSGPQTEPLDALLVDAV